MTLPQSILAADRAIFQTGFEEVSPKGKHDGVHQFGVPPKGNASFAWVQPFIHHLAPVGMDTFLLAGDSGFSNQFSDCPSRSSPCKPKANPQRLTR